jgi:hypothetical protein
MTTDISMIWVTFRREGVHCYPAALTESNLEDVKFLGHPHRHMFHFKVWIEVFHDDRDIEFIQFKRQLENFYIDNTLQLNNKSCEMIARDLHEQIIARYPDRSREIWIEVSEDGENGCLLKFSKYHNNLNREN